MADHPDTPHRLQLHISVDQFFEFEQTAFQTGSDTASYLGTCLTRAMTDARRMVEGLAPSERSNSVSDDDLPPPDNGVVIPIFLGAESYDAFARLSVLCGMSPAEYVTQAILPYMHKDKAQLRMSSLTRKHETVDPNVIDSLAVSDNETFFWANLRLSDSQAVLLQAVSSRVGAVTFTAELAKWIFESASTFVAANNLQLNTVELDMSHLDARNDEQNVLIRLGYDYKQFATIQAAARGFGTSLTDFVSRAFDEIAAATLESRKPGTPLNPDQRKFGRTLGDGYWLPGPDDMPGLS